MMLWDCLKVTVYRVLLGLWENFSEVRINYFKSGRDLRKRCCSVVLRPISALINTF